MRRFVVYSEKQRRPRIDVPFLDDVWVHQHKIIFCSGICWDDFFYTQNLCVTPEIAQELHDSPGFALSPEWAKARLESKHPELLLATECLNLDENEMKAWLVKDIMR